MFETEVVQTLFDLWGPEQIALFLVIALVFAIFWVVQFVQLMLLEDDLFPGRFDKPLWVAVFVLFFILAPFAFVVWKFARREDATEEQRIRRARRQAEDERRTDGSSGTED